MVFQKHPIASKMFMILRKLETKLVKELQQGICLRNAQDYDDRAIASLVQQLGRTLRPNGRYWKRGAIGFISGLWLVVALSQKAFAFALLGAVMPLGIFFGLMWLINWLNPLITWSDYWVIENNGSIIACAKLYEGSSTCELYDVFVVPHWRGNGFGTTLVETLVEKARYPIYLACLPNAIGFYEALGFTCTTEPLDAELMRRLSLTNVHYKKLGLTPMVQTRSVQTRSQA